MNNKSKADLPGRSGRGKFNTDKLSLQKNTYSLCQCQIK